MSQTLIVGIGEAEKKLRDLSRKVENRIVRKGLRAGAKVFKTAAQGEAPVRSGTIRRRIKVRAGKRKKGSISITVGVNAKDFVGEAFYAGFLLYGWRSGPRRLGDARKLNPANNFLKRAFDGSQSRATDTALQTISAGIDAEMESK
jgi:HK97 gp10 family phage protein